MNADPALPVSKGNDAGSIQKVNSGSFPNENQGKFGYIIWSLHKTIPLFPKDTYNSICAGTSTSGLFMKEKGRLGDTPVVGNISTILFLIIKFLLLSN